MFSDSQLKPTYFTDKQPFTSGLKIYDFAYELGAQLFKAHLISESFRAERKIRVR